MKISKLMQQSGVSFGTSGARGLVSKMTDEVCFAYVLGFLKYLESIGEYQVGGDVALAGDLRFSTPRILQACNAAVSFYGGNVIFCGYVPTPALCLYAYGRKIPSLMVTGSHIPADRNGIKFNRISGEFLKSDEIGLGEQDIEIPDNYFNKAGDLLETISFPKVTVIQSVYIERYKDFFGENALDGMRIGIYQHSAVGRDVLVDLVQNLGGEAVVLGRSDNFISVDTEAVRKEDIELARQWASEGTLDSIITTDGDSDRPLLSDEQGVWMRGDVLGVFSVKFLGIKGVATPISSNTLLEKSCSDVRVVRTKIGSPYVIEGMGVLTDQGFLPSAGYEANGGFLLGSPVQQQGRVLSALPTRDSLLPILCLLVTAKNNKKKISELLKNLPQRYTMSDRIQDLPSSLSRNRLIYLKDNISHEMEELGFVELCGSICSVNEIDGVRVTFSNGDILHLRPSGNAPELRVYVESSTEKRGSLLLDRAMSLFSSWKGEL